MSGRATGLFGCSNSSSEPMSNPAPAIAALCPCRGGSRRDRGPQRREPFLPPGKASPAADVLEEHQPPAGTEHAVALGERAGRVGDRAQHQRGHHHVEALVGEGQHLGGGAAQLDGHERHRRLGGQAGAHGRVGLAGDELAGVTVVGQVRRRCPRRARAPHRRGRRATRRGAGRASRARAGAAARRTAPRTRGGLSRGCYRAAPRAVRRTSTRRGWWPARTAACPAARR